MFSQQYKLRKANLVPIHEKGDKQVINYRPVSLLLICGENFEKMIFNDTHGEALCFTQFNTRMATWLLLTFFICSYAQLSSIYYECRYLKNMIHQINSKNE